MKTEDRRPEAASDAANKRGPVRRLAPELHLDEGFTGYHLARALALMGAFEREAMYARMAVRNKNVTSARYWAGEARKQWRALCDHLRPLGSEVAA
jgi:hypothetical protein